jgi:putative phosphoribosyl transferase
MSFRDRKQAGQILASKLAHYAGNSNVLVLGLPRGGVPVAAEVAKALDAPLDVFVVRKLGVPGYEELAFGAIASGGIRVLNRNTVEDLDIPHEVIEAVERRELRELHRRERAYRGKLPPADVTGRIVILVDDGIATGSSIRAAIDALRLRHAARIIVAVPVAAAVTARQVAREADELVCVASPEEFSAVGEWYADFQPTTDEEVSRALQTSDLRTSLQAT